MRLRCGRVRRDAFGSHGMCGYCIESAYFDGTPSNGMYIEGPLQYIHLQESQDWFEYYNSRQSGFGKLCDMIALCRAWDDMFFRPGKDKLFGLRRNMGGRWSALVQWLQPCAPSSRWEWLTPNGGFCLDPDIESAKRVLQDYSAVHLGCRDFKKSFRRVSVDRQEITPEQMFWVYVSLVLVDRFDPVQLEVGVIALNLPKKTPGFAGMDLWLQRRAVRAVVRSNGSGFMSLHREEMRDEVVSSVAASVRDDAGYLMGLERSIHHATGK